MILGAQLVVHEEDGDLGTGEEEDDVHDEGEAEDVVVLVHPQGRHDEEQLDVGGREGDHAGEGDGDVRVEEEAGIGDGPGDGRRDGGVGDGLGLVAEVRAEEDEGNRDAAPHGPDDEDVEEGDRPDGMLERQDDVEEDEQPEARGRERRGRQEGAGLPRPAAERLVQATGRVSGHDAAEHVQDERGDHEAAPPGGVEEAHGTEDDGEETGDAQLQPGADEDAVHHGGVLGRTEDVGVDELPPGLVDLLVGLLVGEGGHGVVSGNVPPEVAHEDGDDEQTEEQNDEDGVGDGVPVDLGGDQMVLVEVDVPPRRPGHLALVPEDVVRVHDLLVLLDDLVGRDVLPAHVLPVGTGGEGLGVALGRRAVPLVAAEEVVRDAHGLDGEADDAVAVVGGRRRVGLVVVDVDVDVVVHVGVLGVAGTGVDKANGEAAGVVLLLLSGLGQSDGGRGDVVDDPVVVVAVADVHPEVPGLDLAEPDLAQDLAVRLLPHVEGVG
mmetsp:Transcript_22052/g.52188  ORF Transcript_22052/g.52188 Transcript_22052/m.52188 type:complete len:493 (-) Transcript_22052:504-1982(-)